MKYTRYDWKKKKNKGGEVGKVIIILSSIALTAILVATLMSKFIFKNPFNDKQNQAGNDKPTVINSENKKDEKSLNQVKEDKLSLSIVQCGVYSKQENAEEQKNKLKDKYQAFAVNDNDKFRVVAFIGDYDKSKEISETLNGEGVTNMVARYEIEKSNKSSKVLAEMVDGYIKIVRKLEEDDVRSVKTSDFKNWVNSLKEDSKSEHIELIKEVKGEIAKLPNEIKKENLEECYKTIYKMTNPFRAK